MATCKFCGLEVNRLHYGIVDCVQGYRSYVANLLANMDNLQRQLPLGEAAFVGPIARDVKARLWLEGQVTPEAIDQLIKTLELLKDTYQQAAPLPATDSEAKSE